MTVAYLGPQGTFTEQALIAFADSGFFGVASNDIEPCAVDSPAAGLDAVRNGRATFAVVAIENSVDGAVTPTFDALADKGGVQIFGETDITIAFTIMAGRKMSASSITSFATHPVARQQVARWLLKHAPKADYIPASSNAAAARMVAEGKVDAAAAPARAAELFGLVPLADNVADVAGARTRFVVVGATAAPASPTGSDRTAVVFTLPNKPGSLVRALTEFSSRGVDLTRIESRPTRTGLGTYRFHADLVGHINDPVVGEALMALYSHCSHIAFLGSWPAASGDAQEGLHTETGAVQPDAPTVPAPQVVREKQDKARRWLEAARKGRAS
ncbi:prephenate dehydratase [Corynebacterium mendelii]|uniref:Prephenate dehydratase n=1 Tax=Corynebacterium mendelii TaxID=2765362 RepID=A0A939E231_9CORY|nr:prephenate dehydratase [Corynebacterium mendelii]MBN9645313.1 prephenate dehydratase [Corynebacterium mendelii]